MMSVAQALQHFISGLELTTGQQRKAAEQKEVVRGYLARGLSLERHFLSGSYARNTAIRPLHDIDMIIVLDPRYHGELRNDRPTRCLKEVRRVLDLSYPNKSLPDLQNRSVNIEFSETGIGYDVVPAFAHGSAFYIPDRETDGWILSNPEKHKSFSTRANEAAGKKLKPLIKALKYWNTEQGKLVRSFHLEVMCCHEMNSPADSYLDGLYQLFNGASNRVWNSCPEPAGLGAPLDSDVSQGKRQQASERMRAAAARIEKAIAYAHDGYTQYAHHQLRQVFGDRYPEKGKAGGPAPAVSTSPKGSRSTDRSNSRFG